MTASLENAEHVDVAEWLTLATAPSPTKLKPGQTPNALNVWVDEKPGSVITANGYVKVGTLPSNNPGTFCINYFNTSNGIQAYVCSDNATVWQTFDFQNFTTIATGLSSVFQMRGLVVRNKLWLTNGNDPVMTWDGATLTQLNGSGSTPNVPKGTYITYHDERVWLYNVPSSRSLCYFSSLTDSSGNIIAPDNASAWPNDNSLQISEGDADYGTGLFLYRGYVHFFKQYSIWRLVGYDEYTYSRVKTRASTGTRFNESIQIMDSLLNFIGIDGIYTFDGEETNRISDLIDPATATQESFGFNQLQQPNVNNQFWEVTATSDWNAGTVSRNETIADSLALAPCDATQSDFQNGPTQTNIDLTTNPNFVQIAEQSSGGSSIRVGQGINAFFDLTGHNEPTAGQASYLTDGDLTRFCGIAINQTSSPVTVAMTVDLTDDQVTHVNIGRIIVSDYQTDNGNVNNLVHIQVNTGAYQTNGGTQGTWTNVYSVPNGTGYPFNPTNITVDFAVLNAIQIRILIQAISNNFQCTELAAYVPAFQTTAKFVSQTLDLNADPSTAGYFCCDQVVPSPSTLSFFTQTSEDGSSWDAETAVTLIGENAGRPNIYQVNSTARKYMRWIAYFTSDGSVTPTITNVYLMTQYISAIHDTGGSIYTWGAFQSDYVLNGFAINFYYRGATTSGGITGASWNLIVPGGVLTIPTSYLFVQFRFEITGGSSAQIPIINNVTINWVLGSGTQPPILQNVASYFWRNRYWLAAAGSGSTSNSVILIYGKKTFGNPWQLKDWSILSFTRYFDNLYGQSSIDGSIYQLDTGYSKNGVAMNSIFETGDFLFGGFQVQTIEIDIEVEQTGAYDLFVGISIDRGQTYTDYPVDLTPNGNLSHIKKVNVDSFTVDRFRVRVYINDIDRPFEVHNLRVYYEATSERGSINSN